MQLGRFFLIFVLLSTLLVACREPGPGSVSGQIKALSADGVVKNIAGAQVILRGARDTQTTVSTAGEESGDQADASSNYSFDKVPAGTYTMAVTPPAGSGLQPEDDITLEVKADEGFPQSVMLLAEGIAKPRPLAPSELNPGEAGYVKPNGERVVYQQGGGFDMTDALLMYMIMRNPPSFGYGAPPVIVGSPPGSANPGYRVDPPRSTTSTGQRVTERKPSVAGQGSTRPGAAPAAGPGPSVNGSNPSGSSATKPGAPSSNGSSPNGSVDSKPSNAPSQGISRPSSAPPRVSAPSRPSFGRSGGGRK
jgi:hypothetical protein